jgi:hypothetical protein
MEIPPVNKIQASAIRRVLVIVSLSLIENAHSEQDERPGARQNSCKNLSGQPCRGQVQVIGENLENSQRDISGVYNCRGSHQQRNPANRAVLGPQHGAGRNRQQQELRIVWTMITHEHGKRQDGRERKPSSALRKSQSESAYRPHQQKRSADQIGDPIVEARIVTEDADGGLKVDDHIGAISTSRGGRPWVAGPTRSRSRQKDGVQFLHPMRRNGRYPQNGCQAQDNGNQEGLQRASPADPTRQQKIEPDQARVMGLQGETHRQT